MSTAVKVFAILFSLSAAGAATGQPGKLSKNEVGTSNGVPRGPVGLPADPLGSGAAGIGNTELSTSTRFGTQGSQQQPGTRGSDANLGIGSGRAADEALDTDLSSPLRHHYSLGVTGGAGPTGGGSTGFDY